MRRRKRNAGRRKQGASGVRASPVFPFPLSAPGGPISFPFEPESCCRDQVAAVSDAFRPFS